MAHGGRIGVYTSVVDHIRDVSVNAPIEAAIMLVQSTTLPDPADPLKLPWSFEAAIASYRRVIGPLTDEQVELVREATR